MSYGTEWVASIVSAAVVIVWLIHIIGLIDTLNSRIDRIDALNSRIDRIDALNPHAHLLGKTVEYRKFEASDWQLGVVWCVGIHGGLCIRDADYLDVPGKWIKSDQVPMRVREMRDGKD